MRNSIHTINKTEFLYDSLHVSSTIYVQSRIYSVFKRNEQDIHLLGYYCTLKFWWVRAEGPKSLTFSLNMGRFVGNNMEIEMWNVFVGSKAHEIHLNHDLNRPMPICDET